MRATNGVNVVDVVHAVAKSDNVGTGVAKARLASESKFSVPLLERLIRGEAVSPDAQNRFYEAVKARNLGFSMDDLFPHLLLQTKTGRLRQTKVKKKN